MRRLSKLDYGLIAAILLPLIGIIPSFTGGVIASADGPLHVLRIYAMTEALQHGDLYPRWINYFHLGYGYPIFNFYAPGVFYLSGWLGVLGVDAPVAFTLVGALAWILGSVGTYRLARTFLPGSAALLAAAVWSYAPSRLYEVWDQGSLPQAMAAACVPWVFYGLVAASQKPTRRAVVWVALPFAALIFSHQPITFIASLFIAPAALILPLWASRQERATLMQRYLTVFGGLALGVGVAAIFLLPVFLELRFVEAFRGAEDNVPYLISNFLRPSEVFAQPLPMDFTDLRFEMPTTLGLIAGVLAVPGIIALAVKRRFAVLALLLVASGFMLFMLVEQSLPLWLTIPFFRQLRFSERFLRVGIVFFALMGGAAVTLLPERWRVYGLSVALALTIAAGLPLAYPSERTLDWRNLRPIAELDFERETAVFGTTSYNEFNPIWGERINHDMPASRSRYEDNPMELIVYRRDMRDDPTLEVEQLADDTVRVTVPEPRTIRFRQYYFPGWTGTLNGDPADIYPEDNIGLIALDVPAGTHTITLDYRGTTVQRVGTTITLLSLAALGVLVVTGRGQTAFSPATPTLAPRPALLISAGLVGFALLNALYIAPHTNWFRYRSPADAPAYMEQRLDMTFTAPNGDSFTLLGYTLPTEEAAPDEILPITLYWRAERVIEGRYRPLVQLVNPSVTEAWAVSEPFFPGGGHTPGYPPDRFASDLHEMRVFDFAPPYVGRIMVQMIDTSTDAALTLDDGADRLLLPENVRVLGDGTPAAQTLDYTLSDTIALHCASVEDDGDIYTVNLHWHVTAQPPADYATFVHGLDANDELVAQGDDAPLNADYPTSLWQPGQNLHDSYSLPADPAIESIAVGLYDPNANNARLTVTQGDQAVPNNAIILPLESNECLP